METLVLQVLTCICTAAVITTFIGVLLSALKDVFN